MKTKTYHAILEIITSFPRGEKVINQDICYVTVYPFWPNSMVWVNLCNFMPLVSSNSVLIVNLDCYLMLTFISGSLCVRLLSHDLEADVQHGEHASLMKFHRFFGSDFEMQFACKFRVIPLIFCWFL